MPHLEFDRLKKQDISEAFHLSSQAGWNQTEADWWRLLDLNPDGVFAGRLAGRLVATSTLASYGHDLSWIGMVIVDRDCRGQGVGKAVLEHVIKMGARGKTSLIGLDATDLGQPLYLKYGFFAVCPIDRWSGTLRVSAVSAEGKKMRDEHLEGVVTVDRRICGIDREPLLRHLFAENSVHGWVLTGSAGIQSYTFLRPGRTYWHLGPLIATNLEDFSALLHAVSEALAGEPVLMDAVREKTTSELLVGGGMQIKRSLTRMTYLMPRPALTGEKLRLATAFEWG